MSEYPTAQECQGKWVQLVNGWIVGPVFLEEGETPFVNAHGNYGRRYLPAMDFVGTRQEQPQMIKRIVEKPIVTEGL